MQNNILAKINYLLAKLTDEQYAPFKEIYKNMKEEYDKRYEDIFGVGQNRLYLDTTINMSAEDYTKANFSFLMTRLNRLFIVVLKRKYKFKDPFTDLINNRVYEDTGREYRLTKLLQRLKDKNIKDITEGQYENIDNIFNEYKSYYKEGMIQHYISLIPPRELFKDNMMELTVVISKDPYDIAGMSTDRRWKSCMKLSNGEFDRGGAYSSTLKEDVKLGTLVAYLIAKNDKNIEAPYARIAIKPHRSMQDENKIRLFAEDKQYNDNSLSMDIYKEFTRVVETFVEEIQDDENGLFMLFNKLYNDSGKNVKSRGKFAIDSVLDVTDLFGFDTKQTKERVIPVAYMNNNKYINLMKQFSDCLRELNSTVNRDLAKTRNSNPEIYHIKFIPDYDSYVNKMVYTVYDNKYTKIEDIPEFFNRIYSDYRDVEGLINKTLLLIQKIIDFDITGFEKDLTMYNVYMEFSTPMDRPLDCNNILEPRFKGYMWHIGNPSFGGHVRTEVEYNDICHIYIYEDGNSIKDYVYRSDINLVVDTQGLKREGISYKKFVSFYVYGTASKQLLEDNKIVSRQESEIEIFDKYVEHFLEGLVLKEYKPKGNKNAE